MFCPREVVAVNRPCSSGLRVRAKELFFLLPEVINFSHFWGKTILMAVKQVGLFLASYSGRVQPSLVSNGPTTQEGLFGPF